MSYVCKTFITDLDSDSFNCVACAGQWKIEKAISKARRHGMKGTVKIAHVCLDLSGKGRGGTDRTYLVSRDGSYTVQN